MTSGQVMSGHVRSCHLLNFGSFANPSYNQRLKEANLIAGIGNDQNFIFVNGGLFSKKVFRGRVFEPEVVQFDRKSRF